MESHTRIVRVPSCSNEEFFSRYAAPGRVGLVGGASLIDRGIRRAERLLVTQRRKSKWSHAFLYEGTREDGKHWILECDLDVLRNGVQENRAAKYGDEKHYPNVASIDFGLSPEQTDAVLAKGLDLLAAGTRYSIREAIGTYIAIRRKKAAHRNPYEREGTLYCSSFVQVLYLVAGIDFALDVHTKNTLPEHIARTPVPHTTYLLDRG